jgi:hypothetical protein
VADTTNQPNLKQLCKAPTFYRRNKNLFSSYEAFRKQLTRRQVNGLADSGAVVATSLGLMVDPPRFQTWLLAPNSQNQAAA